MTFVRILAKSFSVFNILSSISEIGLVASAVFLHLFSLGDLVTRQVPLM